MRGILKSSIAAAARCGIGLAAATFAQPVRGETPADLRAAIETCAICHGKIGHAVAPGVPNLAGQNVEYMINQLQRLAHRSRGDFVEGAIDPPVSGETDPSRARQSEAMTPHASAVSGGILREVAHYYSRLPCVQADTPAAPDPAPGGIAWCADCHAPEKARTIPSIPFIYGQDAEYLEVQLLAFKRSGTRQAQTGADERTHPAMDLFLRDIPDERVREIAQYYSALTCSPQ